MTSRRGFLAALLAPFLARFAPKPKPRGFPNAKYIEWYFSQQPQFQFGWTGFKAAPAKPGEVCFASNILVPNPRTCFKLSPPGGLFQEVPRADVRA